MRLCSIFTVVCAFSVGVAGPQEKAKDQPPAVEKAEPTKQSRRPRDPVQEAQSQAAIDKMIAEYDLTPHPLPPIPDDPPPHEGAMISLALRRRAARPGHRRGARSPAGPADLGRAAGQADGTISLGFYGDVPVKGLTLPQIKVAIIKHLRKFLTR